MSEKRKHQTGAERHPSEFSVPEPDSASRAMTQTEVSRAFGGGLSRERIRQIEQKALRKLKHQLAAKGIGPDDIRL